MKESIENGYLPHGDMGFFKCDKCGHNRFVSYPQAIPIDRTRGWTYEYHCARCGRMMGLTIKGDENDRE